MTRSNSAFVSHIAGAWVRIPDLCNSAIRGSLPRWPGMDSFAR